MILDSSIGGYKQMLVFVDKLLMDLFWIIYVLVVCCCYEFFYFFRDDL